MSVFLTAGELGPICTQCGGDRGNRNPPDSDGYGCLENIHHSEDHDE